MDTHESTIKRSEVWMATLRLWSSYSSKPAPTDKITELADKLERFGLERVTAAYDSILADTTRKQFFPWFSEVAKYIPSANAGTADETTEDIGWYRPDGQHGGNWWRASKTSVMRAAAIMLGDICPTFDHHAGARATFIALAEARDCRPEDMTILGHVYRQCGAGALEIAMRELMSGSATAEQIAYEYLEVGTE